MIPSPEITRRLARACATGLVLLLTLSACGPDRGDLSRKLDHLEIPEEFPVVGETYYGDCDFVSLESAPCPRLSIDFGFAGGSPEAARERVLDAIKDAGVSPRPARGDLDYYSFRDGDYSISIQFRDDQDPSVQLPEGVLMSVSISPASHLDI